MPVTLTSEQIVLDRIKIAKGREPDEANVRRLMTSIAAIGVLQPIVCRRRSPGMGIELVFGLDRLTACKRLKQRATLARVVMGSTDEINLWCAQAAVDENQVRRISQVPADPNVVSLVERRKAFLNAS